METIAPSFCPRVGWPDSEAACGKTGNASKSLRIQDELSCCGCNDVRLETNYGGNLVADKVIANGEAGDDYGAGNA